MAGRIAELKTRTAPGIKEGNDLREIVRDFNRGASTREELSANDRETIAAIEAASEAFVAAQDLARFRDEAKRIAKSVGQFLKWTRDTQDVHLGDQVVKIPAIQTPAVRLLIARTGEQVAAAIAEFVDSREEFSQQQAEHAKTEEAQLEAALDLPLLGDALRLHRALELEYARFAEEQRVDRKLPLYSAKRAAFNVIDALCSSIYRDSLPFGAAHTLTATLARQSSEAA